MFTNRHGLSGAALVALAGVACGQVNEPGTWMEGPADAGGTLAGAQLVEASGGGDLSQILGELEPQDVDVYRIHVCDPSAFDASTVGTTMVDTVLYLFDALGNGVAMSDDAGGPQSMLSGTFLAGLEPGDFYLAVSAKGALPVDLAGDALFLAEPAGAERGPDGPGAGNGVWMFSPGAPVVGPYVVTLSGASLDACLVAETRAFGLAMSARGGSALSRSSSSAVTINSPGGAGGVEFHFGGVQGGAPVFGVNPAVMAPDATMSDTQFGSIGGAPGQQLGTLFASAAGGRLLGGADFTPIGAPTYTVSAMLDGMLVDVASNLTGPMIDYAATARCKKKTSIDDCPTWRAMSNRVDFDEPMLVSLAGREPVMADGLCVCPESGSPIDVGDVSSEVVMVTGIPMFSVESGGVTMFDAVHEGLGEVLFVGTGGLLHVSNIGSSGQDGVDIRLKPVQQFKVGLEIPDATTMPTNAFLQAEAFGTVGGAAGTHLGTVVLRGTGPTGDNGVTIDADLGAISSPTQRVMVLSGGAVVADFPGHGGPVGSARGWPRWLGKLGGRTECFVGSWHSPTTFRIDGALFVGDELRILAESSASPVESKSGLRITGAGLGGFEISGVDVSAPCRVDLDGDGALTIFDFLAFQNLFAAGDPSADFDGDGSLTIFDFLAFQNEFDAGCA